MLYARGIRGVVIIPLRQPPTAFEWKRFSVVSLGENLAHLGLHYVTYDHDFCISSTYQKLREHGYRNIGFCNAAGSEFRNRRLWIASYLKCLDVDGIEPDRSRAFLYEEGSDWSPLPWLKVHRFDAVIATLPQEFIRKVKGTRYRVPERLGVAGFSLFPALDPDSAGWMFYPYRLAVSGIDLLHLKMQKGQTGIPAIEERYAITLAGSWREGPTIRQLSKKPVTLPIY